MADSNQQCTISMAESTITPDHVVTEDRRNVSLLPAELWLQILEHEDPKHLWLSVRNVSPVYQSLVERLFTSKYLQRLQIALSLPRRDAASSKLKWPGDAIPGSQLVMAYARLSQDGNRVHLVSPTVVQDRNGERTIEELRNTGILPKERLEEAPTNVNMSTHPMASLTVKLRVEVEWNEVKKRWVWDVEWRSVLSRFFDAKDRQGKRWPTAVLRLPGSEKMRGAAIQAWR